MITSKYGQKWSEDETILAYYYYCLIPFGQIHKNNPAIIRIANLLGRTPSSVTFKMGNLGHFDPELKKRDVTGLSNTSKTDEMVVAMYMQNWEELSSRAKKYEQLLLTNAKSDVFDVFPEGNDIVTETKQREHQDFFRAAVLSSYSNKCCITGLDSADLLIASHIKPWSKSDPKTERTNPSNGLCLNVLHDKAFDKGLITVLPDYTIRVSTKLKHNAENNESYHWLVDCDRKRIILPERFLPDKQFLQYHNDCVFLR